MVVDIDPSARVAVQDLAEQRGSQLVALAFVLTGDGDEAQDLVQAAFLRMLTADIEGVDDRYSYARRVVTNLFLDRARRGVRYREIAASLRLTRPQHDNSTSAVDDRLLLASALDSLRPKERAAVVLRFYADLGDDVIADYLGCSRSTVRTLVHRALPRLRIELERLESMANNRNQQADTTRGERS